MSDPNNTVKVTKDDKKDDGFWKAPGSDLLAIDKWLTDRGLKSTSRTGFAKGISSLFAGEPAPTRPESDYRAWSLPWLATEGANRLFTSSPRALLNTAEDLGRFATGADRLPEPSKRLSSYLMPLPASSDTGAAQQTPMFTDGRVMDAIKAIQGGQGDTTDQTVEETQTPVDYLTEYALQGPDYGAYREAVTGQASDLNAQIQAMYKQLAESAGQNAEQIQGTYDTAIQGIGTGYDTAAQNVNDAYLSGQQQAADQMARLGIEAAAPGILPTQALAQGQAISNLEQGRGSGLAAANRYGATAGGFGQQMAQVAQQQGVEQNASLLNSLQNRLSDSFLRQAEGDYQAQLAAPGYAQDMYSASQLGQPDPRQQQALAEFYADQQQQAIENDLSISQQNQSLYQSLLDAYAPAAGPIDAETQAIIDAEFARLAPIVIGQLEQ
jgi:hypothetical protein